MGRAEDGSGDGEVGEAANVPAIRLNTNDINVGEVMPPVNRKLEVYSRTAI